MRHVRVGDRAMIVEFDSVDDVAAHFVSWNAAGVDGVEELVPAARTILVRTTAHAPADRVFAALQAIPPGTVEVIDDAVDIPVRYDGPDLDDVAGLLGITPDDVVDLHTGQVWTAAFAGFSPGFAYLVGEHEKLNVPRRPSPRTSVPVGSVAVAGEFSGVYPSTSPGGWQIIGTTDLAMWDIHRDPPAIVVPGTRVRFSRA